MQNGGKEIQQTIELNSEYKINLSLIVRVTFILNFAFAFTTM